MTIKNYLSIGILLGISLIIITITPVITVGTCASKPTCHECIQTRACAWCSQRNYDGPRCFKPTDSSFTGDCPEKYIWDPRNEVDRHIANALSYSRSDMISGDRMLSWGDDSYSSLAPSGSSNVVSSSMAAHDSIKQTKPERVNLKLRINEPQRLQIHYSQTEDYPLDVYYLMDLSNSMKDDKEKLSNLGDILSTSIRNITSNFRIGFGSFVNKVVMPEAPYTFKNHMSLSSDPATFLANVKSVISLGYLQATQHQHVDEKLSKHIDGFDAIMQAIVCRSEIGWRDKSRRLLVFSTNVGFNQHSDGKLDSVVVTPNDGYCHLNNGIYTHSTTQDHPSISQINEKVLQNFISIIFGVTEKQSNDYKVLSNHIEGSSVAKLSEDSSNVIELIKDEYNKISSTVEIKDNATNHVKLTYHSGCLSFSGIPRVTNECSGLKVGDSVVFTVEIVVPSCPENPKDWLETIQIYPVGIVESLIVDLEMLCDCPCERRKGKKHSPKCNGHGTYKCGKCECDNTHFGVTCECSISDIHTNLENDLACKPDNTSIECSGRGLCICGACQCNKRYNNDEVISGKYCECDNFSCDRHNGLLCSGPDHGTCACGQCVCQPGWTGDSCNYR